MIQLTGDMTVNIFNRNKVNKRITGIMAVMMLIIVLLSAFYIASHVEHNSVHHNCSDHDCPICACIQQCESMLRGFNDNSQGSAAIFMPLLLIFITISLMTCSRTENTPVSNKVRMNN